MHHAIDILVARRSKPLRRTELRVGVEIADFLQFIEAGKYRLDFPMIFPVVFNAFMLSVSGLDAEGMLDDKTVFESVPEEKSKTLFLIDLRRTEEEIYESVL